jgi:phosphopantothenoylcysteine decarboxylase/phosphopantothenate--cysteine ligase
MPKLLLGVSGGIAAYKALEVVRLATEAGHSVRVIQTPNAQRFVGAASFAALSGGAVLRSEFERDPLRGSYPGEPLPEHDPASHLELVRRADVFLIAPASANTLAKLAHGLADNLLCTAALAASCPLLVAPAMNSRMYEHPATQANLSLLAARGVRVIEPGVGRLGTPGEYGIGRLAEPAELLAAVEAELGVGGAGRFDARDDGGLDGALDDAGAGAGGTARGRGGLYEVGGWSGRRVLVTAGGTREAIDAVRYIGNRSSGRMGFAIAGAAAERGAEVVVIAANVALERDPRIRYVDVESAAELARACESELDGADVLVMCAAVADFVPVGKLNGKLSRREQERLTLELEASPDILAMLSARRRSNQTLVGFAAEHGAGGLERARAKLVGKQLDLIVYNDIAEPGIGFDAIENEVTLISADGERLLRRSPKADIAGALLDAIEELAVRA